MSTTAKIKNELVRLLNMEENKAGLTFSEVWEKLEETDFKDELYNQKGERRSGTLVGLSTRIKQNKVPGVKLIKNANNNLVFVSSSNEVEYLNNLTTKFLNEATAYKLKTADYTVEQKKVIEEFGEVLTKLKQATTKLKKVSDDIEVDKLAAQIKKVAFKEDVKEEAKKEIPKVEGKKEETQKVAPAVSKKVAETKVKSETKKTATEPVKKANTSTKK